MQIRAGFLAALAALAPSILAQSPSTLKNAAGIEFVKIPAGEFMMGCLASDKDCIEDEVPLHKVRLTKPFEMGKYEVTQEQWQALMGSNPSEIKGPKLPVETVNKAEAQSFLDRLNAKKDGYTYRLPTEAEWEYAARAGAPEPPREKLGDYAWFSDNSEDESHPVGLKKPNAWGLYDMLGNVRELVSDQAGYYDDVALGEDVTIDPKGPRGRGGGGPGGGGPGGKGKGGAPPPKGFDAKGRLVINGAPQPVFRGGAWDNRAPYVRLSARYYYYDMDLKLSDIGFRVVREAQ